MIILPAEEEITARKELLEVVQNTLGHPLEETKFEGLFRIQTELRLAHRQLVAQLDSKQVSPEGYLERFTDLQLTKAHEIRAFLGDKDFIGIFGEAGLHPEGMEKRKLFLSQFPSHKDNSP